MNIIKTTYSLEYLPHIADELMQFIKDQNIDIITLEGSIGAGKTSLVRTILQKMGVAQQVSSPTFSYINVYELPGGKKVYHFDLYRFSRLQQFYDAGFDEYLQDEQALICIEWPELIQKELCGVICSIYIEYVSADLREITYSCKIK